ncbi:enoyl-CoA hydratase/isomerase family protein [bacterium]|nr:enoyl-CoA hydratase/isomerase family protein [bacterium]
MDFAAHIQSLAAYLSVELTDGVAVVRCTDEFPLLELDLESKNVLQKLFDAASASADVRAVVLRGTARCFSGELMDRFWRLVLEQDRSADNVATPHSATGTTDFRRGETGVQQLARNIRQCPKVVVMALQGEVVTPFLGASLACDYRVVAEDTVFRNRAYQFGMPPGGALTYLLPAYIGFGRASAILLEGRDIPAAEALELGLVSRVVPADQLEAAALDVARRAAAQPPQAVAAVKALLTQSLHGLSEHYELETALITRCMYALASDEK